MPSEPRYLVVMGVAGCGKSTLAAALAARLGWPFAEGDALHPAANLEKMAAGVPLTDADREPWLRRVAGALAAWRAAETSGVVTCSALKQRYRDIIRNGADDVCFLYIRGGREEIAARLGARRGHFMPAALLASQFEDLQEPAAPECFVVVDVAVPVEHAVAEVLESKQPLF